METNSMNKQIDPGSEQIEDIELSPTELIKKFQHRPANIRNICVMAHVDHGKTSLVDSLISYNNIINPKLAGDIRYMDSRPDEQERCITMKSSSISITYNSQVHEDNYLINLIDSPGHVDFSSEIFSALKICDGAIIMIDVVEGICSQTEFVIKQAWDENIRCVLVLNKIDRLISEIQLDPIDAYIHLNNLLEKANSLMGSLILRDINKDKEKDQTANEVDKNGQGSNSEKLEQGEIDIDKLIEEKENELYFSPEKGNVIFTSAIDNWGFTLETFAEILSKKIGFKKEAIRNVLWGDYYFNAKKKKIYTDPEMANNSKPMFVEFILDNIYKLYKMILVEKDTEKIQKAAKSINVTLNQKELNASDKRQVLKTIFRQWLPIPPTVFDVVIKHLPNPMKGFSNKIDLLFPDYKVSHNDYPLISKLKSFYSSPNSISAADDFLPSIAFISKMVPLPRKNIGGEVFEYNYTENEKDPKDEIKFMAFARNYCGTFKKGHEYFVIGPKHDPKTNNYDIKKYKFDNLYYFMGQYLEEVNEVPPGNIFSVGGLENCVYKTATISGVFDAPAIIPGNINKNSIIKVSIVTEDLRDMTKLVDGLKKLYKSDPAVDYYVQSNGEHILVTAGEVHLERCIKDLEDQLAQVKVKTSPPIVNFKEGLANQNYQLRRRNKQSDKKIENEKTVKEKERKKDLNKGYVLDEGEGNIDVDDQDEILKSCTPMILTKEVKTKKPEEKISKHKVKDIKSIKEKTNFYIEKNRAAAVIKSSNVGKNKNSAEGKESGPKTEKAYAEDITPNNLCKLAVSSVGMTSQLIEYLEKHENYIKELDNRALEISSLEGLEQFKLFKQNLLDLIENKRLKQLIESNLFSFGPTTCLQNMLIIKHIPEKCSYFHRVKLTSGGDDSEDMDIVNKLFNKPEEVKVNIDDESNKSNTLEEGLSEIKSSVKSTSNKSNNPASISQKSGVKGKREKEITSEKTVTNSTLEEDLSTHLKDQVSMKEFLNSIKSGFDLAVLNGPLCEENMYGVIFVIEDIIISKPENTKVEDKSETKEKNESVDNISSFSKEKEGVEEVVNTDLSKDLKSLNNNMNSFNNLNTLDTNVNDTQPPNNENEININTEINTNTETASVNNLIQNIATTSAKPLQEENKSDIHSLSSKQFNLYGPFLGQIIGTVKDCCKRAYFNGEPRLYEAIYLCHFQMKQEHVGKIHSVISRRRGNIINEYSNDESIICTIEAVVPVAESFGFVEEIRKNTSGMANPMLQFYKWEMIDIDPFYMPIDKEYIDNFGVNVDAPNLAKNYINKIRLRKGLPIDEKIVKNAEKQNTLTKMR